MTGGPAWTSRRSSSGARRLSPEPIPASDRGHLTAGSGIEASRRTSALPAAAGTLAERSYHVHLAAIVLRDRSVRPVPAMAGGERRPIRGAAGAGAPEVDDAVRRPSPR